MKVNHRSSVETDIDGIKTRDSISLWDKSDGNLFYWSGGTRHRGGVSLIQAFMRNCGNLCSNAKGKAQAKEVARLKTEVLHRGGLTCSSDEAAVMAVEQRS